MNLILNHLRGAALALPAGLALLTGCATSPHYVADGPRFRDEAAANLIVRYFSENTVFMLHPDRHEGPFQRIFTRQQVCQAVAGQPGERNFAVVIINNYRIRSLEEQDKQKWVANLSGLNYRRVVFLRGTSRDNVNGLRIVSDTLLAGRTPDPMGIHWASVGPTPVLAP